ncbi:hypothetical protein MJO47_09360 [Desulfuromonas sp. KJ2020]|uniref:hypothetical protein n=1 Tax=Desulfuromonas sp. KJ2020 TaxID=2919173 RepID=UPI0020A73BFA|nr:hypothetical protein [Desulfuromonas sp. KJ2020]MCP3177305.1 hypothetical protein [Desulfuromonas sp. KJ2020]
MTKRQQIVDALDARLKSITMANGYSTDIGKKVSAWRSAPLAESEPFVLIYRDTECPKEAPEAGRHRHSLQIEMTILVRSSTSPGTVRAMIGDVVKAIGTDPRLGGLALWAALVADSLAVERETRTLAGADLSWQITYSTPLWEV